MPFFGPPNVEKLEAKRDIEGLIKALTYKGRDETWQRLRLASAQALARIGKPAVEPLITALTSGDWHLREESIRVLGTLADERAVAPLIVALRETIAAHHFASVLQKQDPAVQPTTMETVRMFSALRNRGTVYPAIVEALAKIGSLSVESLMSVFTNLREDAELRAAVSEALARIGSSAVPSLVAALNDTDWVIREATAELLGSIGDTRAIEPLTALLKNEHGSTLKAVAGALGKLGWHPVGEAGAHYWCAFEKWECCIDLGAAAVAPLIASLASRDEVARQHIILALGQIGDARAVEPCLLVLQSDPSVVVRQAAAEALGELGDARAIKVLLATLRASQDGAVRQTVANALHKLGWQPVGEIGAYYWCALQEWESCVAIGAAAVVPLLAALSERDTRQNVIWALGQIGDAQAAEPLADILRGESSAPARQAAIEALVRIGSPAITPLMSILSNGSETAREAVAETLARIGGSAIEQLVAALQGSSREVREALVKALGKVESVQAIEALKTALITQQGTTRRAAAEGLKHLGWRPEGEAEAYYWLALRDRDRCISMGAAAVMPLVTALFDHEPSVRLLAAETLGNLGDMRAADALVLVIKDDRDSRVRITAAEALGQLADSRTVKSLVGGLAERIIESANANNNPRYGPDGEEYAGARCHAAFELALLHVDASVDALIDWLHDWAPETRERAALALGLLGDPRAVDALVDRALHDDYRVHLGERLGHPGHRTVRCAAVMALRRMKDAKALQALSLVPGETLKAVDEYIGKTAYELTEFGYM